jgi:hypothetical protein
MKRPSPQGENFEHEATLLSKGDFIKYLDRMLNSKKRMRQDKVFRLAFPIYHIFKKTGSGSL